MLAMAIMTVHELAHAVAASRLGYKISSVKVMPYGLSLVGAFESASCRDECIIAAAGPLVNLICAASFGLSALAFPATRAFFSPIISSSLAMLFVNLLPVYPLDGGRVALALLARKRGRAAAYRILRPVGIVLGTVFTLLFISSCFFVTNISYAAMGGFMLLSASVPDDSCAYETLYVLGSRRRRLKKGLCVRRIMINKNSPVSALMRWLNHGYVTEFMIVDDSEKQLFTLTESELEHISGEQMYDSVEKLRKNGKNV